MKDLVDLKEMTVQELLDNGARVEIGYYKSFEYTKSEAVETIEGFGLKPELKERRLTEWLVGESEFSDGELRVSVHYDNEREPEESRARLTEYERGLRDSGHKQTDFL